MSEDQNIELDTLEIKASSSNPIVWLSDNFSEDWYLDSLHEARSAKNGPDVHNSIRREIIFSVCFLESYIFEWVRDMLEIEQIDEYFSSQKGTTGYHRELKDKWKEIPKKLFENNKILKNPSLDLSGLGELVIFRNGLVHGAASKPVTNSLTADDQKIRSKEHLRKKSPGWATGIAFDLVANLHETLGTSVPDYLEKP